MKSNIKLFIFTNISIIILEPLTVGFVTYLISNNIQTSIIWGLIWFALGLIIGIILKMISKNSFELLELDDVDDEYFINCFNEINKEFEKYNNRNIKVKYCDSVPYPIGVTGNVMIVNKTYFTNRKYRLCLKGAICHEFGHLISGLTKHDKIIYFHLSFIFSFLMHMIFFMSLSQKKIWTVIGYILLIPSYILNAFNIVSWFIFYHMDEYYANYNGAMLGGLEELRTWYYDNNLPLLSVLSDLKHPTSHKMLQVLDKQFNRNDFEKQVFVASDKIYDVVGEDKNKIKFSYYRHHRHESDDFMYEYGMCYFYGRGVEKDLDKALSILNNCHSDKAKKIIETYMKGE